MTRNPIYRFMSAGLLIPLVAATLLIAAAPASAATISVNCDTGGNLQSKLTSAPNGSTILIKGTCHGNFSFGGKGLTLKGNPKATLDGMNSGITLFANSAGYVVHLVGLTVTGGAWTVGAGILSTGTLSLKNVKVIGNEASSNATAEGGGVFAFGKLTVDSSTISGNRASSIGNGAVAIGAGITAFGNTTITNSVLSGNVATANSGSGNSEVDGSAVATGAKLTIKNSKIINNRVGATGDGGVAFGPGVYVDSGSGALVSLTKTTVSGNSAGASSTTASGAATAGTVFVTGAAVTLTSSKVTNNTGATNTPGATGQAFGAGVYNDTAITLKGSSVSGNTLLAVGTSTSVIATGLYSAAVHLTGSSVSGNVGTATSSGGTAAAVADVYGTVVTLSKSTVNGNSLSADATGGSGQAIAGVFASSVNLNASTISRNTLSARTRTSGQSASAIGAGLYTGAGPITNSTIALNHAKGTSPGTGGTTAAIAGGIYDTGTANLKDVTVAGNTVAGSGDTLTRLAGGLYGASGVNLQGTIIGSNSAAASPDCFNGPTSQGHNLIGKTAGCTFTKLGSDKVNKSPKLGNLSNNGGPTQTMAIAATSPARDAGVCPPSVDQRGVHRPQGSKCDIGAFELKGSEAHTASALFRIPAYKLYAGTSTSSAVIQAALSRVLRSLPDPLAVLEGAGQLRSHRPTLP